MILVIDFAIKLVLIFNLSAEVSTCLQQAGTGGHWRALDK
jgi:hypothetical protein